MAAAMATRHVVRRPAGRPRAVRFTPRSTPAAAAKVRRLAISIQSGASSNTVGGVSSSARNVLSGNADYGVVIFGNGTTWVKQTSSTSQGLTGVWGDAATDVYAVGAGGAIIHLKSSGSWSSMSSGSSNDLAAIGGSAATDIWAVGDNGTALHYDGKIWTRIPTGSSAYLTGIDSQGRTTIELSGPLPTGTSSVVASDAAIRPALAKRADL